MMAYDTYCEEIINWCSNEFKLSGLDIPFQQALPLCPQKRSSQIESTQGNQAVFMVIGLLDQMKSLPSSQ